MNARYALAATYIRFFSWVLRKFGDPDAIESSFRDAVQEVALANDLDADIVEAVGRDKLADILPEIARPS